MLEDVLKISPSRGKRGVEEAQEIVRAYLEGTKPVKAKPAEVKKVTKVIK